MEIENSASFDAALRDGVHLMLGSGFSVLAKDAGGRELPVGFALASELRTEFGIDAAGKLNLPQLYTILSARDREAADDFLRERFSVSSFDQRYLALARLKILMIFTTNIDDLVWKIYEDSRTHYLNDIVTRGPQYRDRASVDFAPLHGSVLDDTRPFRFTSIEVASSFSADPTLWQTFRRRLSAGPTLFWGYSLQDAAALESLQTGGAGAQAVGNNWITLRPSDRHDPIVDYLRALRFQIVFAETSELLDYIDSLAPAPAIVSADSIIDSLSQYLVPTLDRVPQRPVVEFYAGAAPAWSDVFRPDVPRLEQFKRVENSVNEGMDVVVAGIPASGKTTLLMQLAAANVGPGVTLMPQAMTREAAERLVRALGGFEATVVLDRFCDDVDAWNVLHSAPNVRLLAADRDYNIATATHRFDRSGVDFISVSEISELDQGAIRSAIPATVRTPKMVHPRMTAGEVSILDFNLANTTSKSLKARLRDAIADLQVDDPIAGEMLILVAYVHSCGTVLSMDMALAYWGQRLADYTEVFALIERVGKLLSEYEGDLQEEDGQDYFAARSIVVAEAALEAATNSMLRTVLTNFHANLATTRICRFDIFRRRGYSHRTIGRAFANTNEAIAFYDFLLDKDNNAYLLQQKALLLSVRRLYQASFVAIDQALAMSKKKNWRIQATHAELLFDANISLASESVDARNQADRAMALLRDCYLSDRRRSLHAYSYSRRALDYHNQFGDVQARAYLLQAKEWLELVLKNEPYMTSTKYILRNVNSSLS
jgi:tetratricopeptide (TPR) repeat protein